MAILLAGPTQETRRHKPVGAFIALVSGLAALFWASDEAQAQTYIIGRGGWTIDALDTDGVAARTEILNTGDIPIGTFLILCSRQSIKALVSLRAVGFLQGRAEAGRGTASIRFLHGQTPEEYGRHITAAAMLMSNDSFELTDIDPENPGSVLAIAQELAIGAREMRIALHPIQDPSRFNQARRIRLRTSPDKEANAVLTRFERTCSLLRNYRP
jgi:hypothetical protein